MIDRGAVIEYPTIFDFDSYPRPYLILSGRNHPFAGKEYIGVAITTSDHSAAIEIPDSEWEVGGLPRESYVKPWQSAVLKHESVTDAFGKLRGAFVDQVATSLCSLVKAE